MNATTSFHVCLDSECGLSVQITRTSGSVLSLNQYQSDGSVQGSLREAKRAARKLIHGVGGQFWSKVEAFAQLNKGAGMFPFNDRGQRTAYIHVELWS